MKTLRHVSSVLLATDKQKLWDIMTEGDWTEKYMFNCRLVSDYEIGSNVDWKGSFEGQDYFLTGTLLEIESLNFFKYTLIDPDQFDASDPNNFVIISYEIKEQGDKLLLTVVNETNDGNEDRMKEIVGGWEGMVLPAIEALL